MWASTGFTPVNAWRNSDFIFHCATHSYAHSNEFIHAHSCTNLDSEVNGYESSSSDFTIISTPSSDSTPFDPIVCLSDSISYHQVLTDQNTLLKAEIQQLEQSIIDTAKVLAFTPNYSNIQIRGAEIQKLKDDLQETQKGFKLFSEHWF